MVKKKYVNTFVRGPLPGTGFDNRITGRKPTLKEIGIFDEVVGKPERFGAERDEVATGNKNIEERVRRKGLFQERRDDLLRYGAIAGLVVAGAGNLTGDDYLLYFGAGVATMACVDYVAFKAWDFLQDYTMEDKNEN